MLHRQHARQLVVPSPKAQTWPKAPKTNDRRVQKKTRGRQNLLRFHSQVKKCKQSWLSICSLISLTSGLLIGQPLSPTGSPGLLLHQLRGGEGAEPGRPYRHSPDNKQRVLALVQELMSREEDRNEAPTPVLPAWQLWFCATSGQHCLLPLAKRGLPPAEDTGLLLLSSPGSGGGQRVGCRTQCCETREGPLQLSSGGAAQGPT